MIDQLKRGGKGSDDDDGGGSDPYGNPRSPKLTIWDIGPRDLVIYRPVLNLKTDARGRFVSDYGGALIAFDVEVTVETVDE